MSGEESCRRSGDNRVDHRVEIIKEADEIESQLDPALSQRLGQLIGVHDRRRIIDPRCRHHGTFHIPMHMIGDQWCIPDHSPQLKRQNEE